MITYEILHKPKSFLHYLFKPTPAPAKATGDYVVDYWDKSKFITWVETVKAEWKIGELVVTPVTSPITNCFEVVDILELYSHTKWDRMSGQPQVVTLKRGTEYITKSPKELRHLTQQEKTLVNLQHHTQ
jgi:hypothetical protein